MLASHSLVEVASVTPAAAASRTGSARGETSAVAPRPAGDRMPGSAATRLALQGPHPGSAGAIARGVPDVHNELGAARNGRFTPHHPIERAAVVAAASRRVAEPPQPMIACRAP